MTIHITIHRDDGSFWLQGVEEPALFARGDDPVDLFHALMEALVPFCVPVSQVVVDALDMFDRRLSSNPDVFTSIRQFSIDRAIEYMIGDPTWRAPLDSTTAIMRARQDAAYLAHAPNTRWIPTP